MPTLRLDKPKYVLGESIRFWVGVQGGGIAQEYWDTCFLHVTKPDGRTIKSPAGWPCDGPLDCGWTGGSDLGYHLRPDKVGVGSYTLVFEFAGKRTRPVELIVVDLPVFTKIVASLRSPRAGMVTAKDPAPVVLAVQNNTAYPLSFSMNELIWIYVGRDEPQWGLTFSYLMAKLQNLHGPRASTHPDEHGARATTVSLAPGERFEGELSLRDACEFWGPGRFTVRFWTTVAVHVDKGGEAFSDYCPIRIPVSGEARFDVAQDK